MYCLNFRSGLADYYKVVIEFSFIIQQPYLGQANHSTQDLLEIQKNQKKMLKLFMNLNQKVINMYSLQM